MSYAAKHYTEIAGCKYTPGEVIDKPIAPDKLERLLRLGAIEPLAGAPKADDGMPENILPAFESEEDEAPEMDVMDGIVAPAPLEEAPAPRTAARRKKA